MVISYATWQRQFSGAPDVIGRTLRVDAEPRTVIGVMPKGFQLSPWLDDIVMRQSAPAALERRRPVKAMSVKTAKWDAVAELMVAAQGRSLTTLPAVPVRDWMFGDEERLAFLLASSAVLLIGCLTSRICCWPQVPPAEGVCVVSHDGCRPGLVQQLLTDLKAPSAGRWASCWLWPASCCFLIAPEEFPC